MPSAMAKAAPHWRQFALFVTGGLLCALVDIGLLYLLAGIGVHYATATTAGFAAGLLVNFAFHSRVTFNQAATGAGFARFLCVVGLNYLLTMACVAVSVPLLDSPLPGKIAALPLVALNGFLLSKYWIFK